MHRLGSSPGRLFCRLSLRERAPFRGAPADRPTHSPWFCRSAVAFLLLITLIATLGCTRRFYRRWADRDVAEVLREKDVVPQWKIESYNGAYPNAQARFADPTNPDRPPMPPDDPAAKQLAPNPQRPKHGRVARIEGSGYLDLLAAWDAENRGQLGTVEEESPIEQASSKQENPPDKNEAPEALAAPRPLDESCVRRRTPYLITMEQAVELGLINSREFQTKRENLYLAALPVTLERFSFAWQFFASEVAIREWTGANTGFGKGDHWRLNTNAGVTKLFSTGALLLFDFANRTVIDLSGRMKDISVSTINFDFVQPFLRGGGRAVTLEPLTQVERNLVYEIRDYARFREEFFQYIAGGGDLTLYTGARAGFGAALVPGAERLASGNPAAPQILPGAAGRVALANNTAAPSQGYLPTLQTQGNEKIDADNVDRLKRIVKLFEAYEEGGEVSSLNVAQLRLQLNDARTTLLQDTKLHDDALDAFKLQLGVPPALPIELHDAAIKPFMDQYVRYESLIEQFEQVTKELEKYDAPDEAGQIRTRVRKVLTKSDLVVGTVRFKATIEDRWGVWEKRNDKALVEQLLKLRAERRQLLDLKTEREVKEESLTPKEEQRLGTVQRDVSRGEMELALRLYEKMPWRNEKKGSKEAFNKHRESWGGVFNSVIDVLGDAGNERFALIRPLWPALPPLEVADSDLLSRLMRTDDNAANALEEAYALSARVALDNRLDLMNARAQVVDAWRQLAVYANSLLGTFNVGYHMDSSTPPDQARPFAFQPSRTRHQLFLTTDLPLVRLAERNNYRAALIAYQRARRALMEAEDLVVTQVRTDLRQLQFLAMNYPLQQGSAELAYEQLESALETFRAPQPPGQANSAANVAALTQQLQNAYNNLPRVQKLLLGTWIQYQIARQQLYLDLELLPLDSRGVWIDELSHRPLPPAGRDKLGPDHAGGDQRRGDNAEGAAAGIDAPRSAARPHHGALVPGGAN